MKFLCWEEAAATAMKHPEGSAEWCEAMAYLFENGPEELKESFLKKFHECFPELRAVGYDADGTPYYDLESIRRVFNLSDEDAEQLRRDFGQKAPDTLFKIQ